MAKKLTDSLITERSDSHELMWTRSGTGNAVHRLDRECFGRRNEKMMKGFPGAAGPRKGADQTVAGLFRIEPRYFVLRIADRKRSGPG
ncbi:hypothetical protein [Sphingopyxis sp. R3-92]|uniref:hypothetical protein n=1 Tax=Sphingopyxis sp. R3-92 TaxID=3158553 RepID=UPI003EE5C1DC